MAQQLEHNPERQILEQYSENQEQAIAQIRKITENFQFLNHNGYNKDEYQLQLNNFKKVEKVKNQKHHALTQRKIKGSVFDSVQENDWISDFELQTDRQTIIQDQKSHKMNKTSQNNRKTEQNYLRPVKNFKKKTLQEIQAKKKQKLKQLKGTERNNIPLNKFYREKKPLYDKFIQSKTKKETLMKISKIIKENQQVEGLTLHPQINHNYQLPSFQERLQISKQNSSQKQAQILDDYLKDMTFKPRTNPYKKAESKVKQIWKKASKQDKSLSGNALELKGISQSMIKTGSFFSDENSVHYNKNKSCMDIPLQAVDELSYVLEIQELIHE